jgi:TonB family protein
MKVLNLCLVLILLTLASNAPSLEGSSRQNANQTNTKIYEPKEVDRKAKVIKRSEPQYTEQARRNHTSGFVVLRVVLKASGEIGDIKVVRDLPDGLTEECIRVAREIKFEPAMKGGNPVSQYLKVQYTFMAD